jgi:hypothetical protein
MSLRQNKKKASHGPLYVNVYIYDKAYGGPEEGGWWFNTFEPVSSVRVYGKRKIETELLKAENFCNTENEERNSDVESVCSDGKYIVCTEFHKAKFYPRTKPHYE